MQTVPVKLISHRHAENPQIQHSESMSIATILGESGDLRNLEPEVISQMNSTLERLTRPKATSDFPSHQNCAILLDVVVGAVQKIQTSGKDLTRSGPREISTYHCRTNDLLVVAASLFCRAAKVHSSRTRYTPPWKTMQTYICLFAPLVRIGERILNLWVNSDTTELPLVVQLRIQSGIQDNIERMKLLDIGHVGCFLFRKKHFDLALVCFHRLMKTAESRRVNMLLWECAWRVAHESGNPALTLACIKKSKSVMQAADEKAVESDSNDSDSGEEEPLTRIKAAIQQLEKHEQELQLMYTAACSVQDISLFVKPAYERHYVGLISPELANNAALFISKMTQAQEPLRLE